MSSRIRGARLRSPSAKLKAFIIIQLSTYSTCWVRKQFIVNEKELIAAVIHLESMKAQMSRMIQINCEDQALGFSLWSWSCYDPHYSYGRVFRGFRVDDNLQRFRELPSALQRVMTATFTIAGFKKNHFYILCSFKQGPCDFLQGNKK